MNQMHGKMICQFIDYPIDIKPKIWKFEENRSFMMNIPQINITLYKIEKNNSINMHTKECL